jgi:hypothetical protein
MAADRTAESLALSATLSLAYVAPLATSIWPSQTCTSSDYSARMAAGIAWSQPRGQQTSGVTLEDQRGVVHMLMVARIEKAELLLAMSRIVGGVDIQQDLAALMDLLCAEANVLIEQGIVQAQQIAGGLCIFPSASPTTACRIVSL